MWIYNHVSYDKYLASEDNACKDEHDACSDKEVHQDSRRRKDMMDRAIEDAEVGNSIVISEK